MVQTDNLSYQYLGSSPLFFPNLSVDVGQALLIFGASGCGKTTMLHLLAGLRQSRYGKVEVAGTELSNLSAAQMDQFRGLYIGMVYQQSYFIESLSVWDNLMLSPFAADKAKAKAVAERLDIKELLMRYPHQLSVGQQQRVSIARAVVNSPKLILADEPTSALDNDNCDQVIELLMEEAKANEAALIIVTHDERLKSRINKHIELDAIPK